AAPARTCGSYGRYLSSQMSSKRDMLYMLLTMTGHPPQLRVLPGVDPSIEENWPSDILRQLPSDLPARIGIRRQSPAPARCSSQASGRVSTAACPRLDRAAGARRG